MADTRTKKLVRGLEAVLLLCFSTIMMFVLYVIAAPVSLLFGNRYFMAINEACSETLHEVWEVFDGFIKTGVYKFKSVDETIGEPVDKSADD